MPVPVFDAVAVKLTFVPLHIGPAGFATTEVAGVEPGLTATVIVFDTAVVVE